MYPTSQTQDAPASTSCFIGKIREASRVQEKVSLPIPDAIPSGMPCLTMLHALLCVVSLV